MTKPPKELDWLLKCRICKHFQLQTDENVIRCKLKYCGYEPAFEAKNFYELQKELEFIKERENEK